MADTSRVFDIAVYLRAINQLSPTLGAIQEQLEGVSKVASGIADLVIFEKAKETTEAWIGAAADMQTTLASLRIGTGLSDEAIERLTEHAEAFSETAVGSRASAEEWLGGFQKLEQQLHNVAAAQDAADQAAKAALVTGIPYADAITAMTAAQANFKASAGETAGTLAGMYRTFGLGSDTIQQFTTVMARMSGVTGASLEEVGAIAGEAERIMGKGRGVMMLGHFIDELPRIALKAHLDARAGPLAMLEEINARLGGNVTAAGLERMHIDPGLTPELAQLLPHLHEIEQARDVLKNQGPELLGAGVTERTQELQTQLAALQNSWHDLETALGGPIIPRLNWLVTKLTELVTAVRLFVHEHPAVGWVVTGAVIFTALGAAIGLVGTAFGFVASGLGVLAPVIAPVLETLGALVEVGGIAGAALVGIWLVAAAAVGFAVYELITHWHQVMGVIYGWYDDLKVAGGKIIDSIVEGIESKWHHLIDEMHHVGAVIRSYLPFSPAEAGPLRDLHRVRIVETIAERIQAAPALSAMRRVAGAIAIAAPMIAAPAFAGMSGRGAGGAVVVNASFQITISGDADEKTGDRIIKALRPRMRELGNMIHDELVRQERKDF